MLIFWYYRNMRNTFEIVVEYAPNAVVLIDQSGTIAYINKHTEELFGYQRHELIGQQLEMLMPERYRHAHVHMRAAYASAPSVKRMGEHRNLHGLRKDGTEITLEIGLNPISTAEGTMIQASIIDVTERKAQEAIIRKQMIELESKNRELEQFTYIASHDLQEPLRTVSGFIHILKEEHKDSSPKAHEYLYAIERSNKRMRTLVRGLLDFARLGRDRVLSYADSRRIVSDVQADLESLILSTDAMIYVGDLPQLWVYETELHQLIQNLITNAIKFRKENTRLEIRIECRRRDGMWEFSIADNGIGIKPRYFDKIFNIFQRLNAEEDYAGYGIGLANCKKIAELHGGTIRVESEPGTGSTFYFTIPDIKI
jgi:PAS domain S-box-containing protein